MHFKVDLNLIGHLLDHQIDAWDPNLGYYLFTSFLITRKQDCLNFNSIKVNPNEIFIETDLNTINQNILPYLIYTPNVGFIGNDNVTIIFSDLVCS